MKKTIQLVFFFTFLTVSASAQFDSERVSGSSILPTFGNLVRVKNSPKLNFNVSFVNADTSIYAFWDYAYTMGWTSSTFPVIKYKMPNEVRTITDLTIVDSMLFFCGYDTSGVCIIGFYDVLHVSPPGFFPIPSQMVRIRTIPELTSFKKIAAFKSGNTYNVYAIGTYRDTSNNYGDAIIEYRNPTMNNNYQYAPLNSTAILYSDIIDDIVFTDGNIVFVGRDNYHQMPSGYITFRKISKGTGIQSGTLNTIYYYPVSYEYNSVICATHISGEEFAIAYSSISSVYQNDNPIRIRFLTH